MFMLAQFGSLIVAVGYIMLLHSRPPQLNAARRVVYPNGEAE
jgi:hypothetical protein